MATDEEYLDNLLKSLTEGDSQSDGDEDFSMSSDDSGIDADVLADLLAETMPSEDNEAGQTEPNLDVDVFADLLAEDSEEASNESVLTDLLAGESDPADSRAELDGIEDWQSDLDDLLAQADAQVETEVDSAQTNSLDVADLLNASGNETDEISEDDMLSLLEGGSINDIGNADSSEEDTSDSSVENLEDPVSAKDKKKKEKAEKKKKKEKKEKKPSKQKEGEETPAGENSEEQQEADQNEKKAGFFSKVLTYLTEEEDELAGVSDENAEILQALNEEDKGKEKKAGKKKKKKEKAKAAPEDGEEGEAEADTKKKKKKEKKKKEKETENENTVKEKPVKILSRRNMLVLVAACATLIACVLIFSTFLPEYADKQNAHQAFYDGEYEEVYRLLYDKNLNDNDMLIYNKVQTILTIERKLKSYEGNIAINRELEALDALMQGVECYQKLAGTNMYGMEMEVETIYRQICEKLQNNYGITPEEAIEINAYDNELYTRKLISVIEGTAFSLPGEEAPAEDLPPQDILPEEETIISY